MEKDYGLVLSGGGTKGAFEMGVWKALRELKVPISCVVGTSIGAINAAMIAQNDYQIAHDFWSNVTINEVIKLNSTIADKYMNKWSGENSELFRLDFLKDLFHGGLDVTPLRNNINRLISEERIRKSPIRFGLVTVDLTNLTPVEIMIEDIPEGKLHDYILASASLPVFQRHEIDGNTFVDGAFYDNVPINLMINNGYKDIISVEFPDIGIRKKRKDDNINLVVVDNSEFLGMVLEFNPEKIHNNMVMGYLDCKKTFGDLIGKHFYFDVSTPSNSTVTQKVNAFIGTSLQNKSANNHVLSLLNLPDNANQQLILNAIETLTKRTAYKEEEALVLRLMEMTGKILGIERLEIYTPDEFLLKILTTLEELTQSNLNLLKGNKIFKLLNNDDDIDYQPVSPTYFVSIYLLLSESEIGNSNFDIRRIIKHFSPEVALSIIFLIYLHRFLRDRNA